MKKTFYITTPIYYVNDKPHIGHAYTTLLADVLARYQKLFGREVFLLTGTDEHGQKVEQAARKSGMDPKAHCDLYSARFKEAWEKLSIEYSHFIRTTDPDHKAYVAECFQKLWDKGDIYIKEYEGWYSTSEERFFTEKELVDGKDPISGRPVEKIKEKNYFFKMSNYQAWLVDTIEKNPDFIQPGFRKNETLGFLRQPLEDLCVSRPKSRLNWGITLPFDKDYVAYVWMDALLNYLSAVKDRKFSDSKAYWPADYHLIGKDILTTHTVYWTTFLKALDLPLPRHILAHGWWLSDHSRMSKTTGNVVDPIAMAEKYTADVFRYYLMRDMVVGQDASFSENALETIHNAELANDLGNLLSRSHRLLLNFFDGRIPLFQNPDAADTGHMEKINALVPEVENHVEGLRTDQALKSVAALIRDLNRYIDGKAPWKSAKTEPATAGNCLYVVLEGLRIASLLLAPVMPGKMASLRATLLGAATAINYDVEKKFGYLKPGNPVSPLEPLFPRIEIMTPIPVDEKKVDDKKNMAPVPTGSGDGLITIDDFFKTKLITAKVLTAEAVEGTDKLVKLTLDAGEGTPRSVVAGIRESYAPETLPGKNVLLVSNLKPRSLKGIESRGMLLCAKTTVDGKNRLVLMAPEIDVPPGTEVG